LVGTGGGTVGTVGTLERWNTKMPLAGRKFNFSKPHHMTQSNAQVFDRPVTRLNLSINIDKLKEDTFYHIIFAPTRKIELYELPIPYTLNDLPFELVDLSICKLSELRSDITMLSHGIGYGQYIEYMVKNYRNRAFADTRMMICKFQRVIS
jgi:hypothetical protein